MTSATRPPVMGLSDGFGAAEGAELWFPGSQVKAACRRPEVPPRLWSCLLVHVLLGQGLVFLAGRTGAQ